MGQESDYLIFRPDDVDLAQSPLRRSIAEATYVRGAFNPGLARLLNGNLLLMVRMAEALKEPVAGRCVRAIRWTPQGYVLDRHSLDSVNLTDPRQFSVKHVAHRLLALTSLSWLLPVELTPDGREIVRVHYNHAIEPAPLSGIWRRGCPDLQDRQCLVHDDLLSECRAALRDATRLAQWARL